MNENFESGDETVIFVTSGYDHTIKFWQAQRGYCERTIQCQSDTQINCLELTSDGKLLAAGCYQNIRVYDAKSSNSTPLICCNGVQKNVLTVGFEQDSRWMYSAGEDGFIRVWDFRSRSRGLQCAKCFRIDNYINAAVLHPNQAVLYIGSQQGKVYAWDLTADDHEEVGSVEECSIQDLSIDMTGSNLAAVTNKGDLYIWNVFQNRSDI